MPEYIKQRIAEGEHQRLEFKFEVSDFRKIARTLVSFSNSEGGSLLIGVKDNGAIAGVRSEEEYFMIDGAAKMYCKPEVPFKVREWKTDNKKVLEIIIEKGKDKPYKAQDDQGQWIAYTRQGDQNFKTSNIMIKVWESQKAGIMPFIRIRQAEQILLAYLENTKSISISKFRRIAGLSLPEAEEILIGFCLMGLIDTEYTSTAVYFSLASGYEEILKRYL